MTSKQEQWHVDRGIPVAWLIGMLFYAVVQAAVGGWFASNIYSRVSTVELTQAAVAPNTERLTRVEEQLKGITVSMNRVEALLTVRTR